MIRIARDHPVFPGVLLLLLAVLGYSVLANAAARRLSAHAARPAPLDIAAARALADDQGPMSLHVVDASADVGPGSDEAALAKHP